MQRGAGGRIGRDERCYIVIHAAHERAPTLDISAHSLVERSLGNVATPQLWQSAVNRLSSGVSLLIDRLRYKARES